MHQSVQGFWIEGSRRVAILGRVYQLLVLFFQIAAAEIERILQGKEEESHG
jgi:hypothetical protein